MKSLFWVTMILGMALLLVSCSEDRGVEPQTAGGASAAIDPELLAGELMMASGWEFDPEVELPDKLALLQDKGAVCNILEFEREVLVGNIVHYSFLIPVGCGEHEVVRLHRVVKERRPNRPIRTRKTLFGLHGTPGHFEVMFLAGSVMPSAPDDQSIAVYLAQNNVDVWGIDQAYTLLPADTEDFSYMEDWGIQFDADNLRTGMSVARFIRLFTGNGYRKMNLMGYSTGFMTGFAALNMETQLPPWKRQIGGFIPVDFFYKTDDPAWQQSECDYLPEVEGMIQNGVYHNDFGLLFQSVGYLAQFDDDGDSPIVPGLNNLDAALWIGAMTGVIFGMPDPDVHYFGGVFDEDENLVDLQYTELLHYLEWLQQFNNYGSNLLDYDITLLHCDEADSPHDDYLGEINVPVFFLGANGGWGDMMEHTASLIGSDDITLLNVQLQSEKLLDIGHVDIFTAMNAQQDCWQPVLEWIESHTRPREGAKPYTVNTAN